jgi:IS4 transposase
MERVFRSEKIDLLFEETAQKQYTRELLFSTVVNLFTNLPCSVASAEKVAQLYLKRWTVEGMFQIITDVFDCEIKTLGYPKAALLAFCMALVAYNLLSVIIVALRSVHGAGKVDAGISSYYLAEEIQGTYRGMMIAISVTEWEVFANMSWFDFCSSLRSKPKFI